jgi:hypothetical protein
MERYSGFSIKLIHVLKKGCWTALVVGTEGEKHQFSLSQGPVLSVECRSLRLRRKEERAKVVSLNHGLRLAG